MTIPTPELLHLANIALKVAVKKIGSTKAFKNSIEKWTNVVLFCKFISTT